MLNDVIKSMATFSEHQTRHHISTHLLADQVSRINQYVESKLSEWNNGNRTKKGTLATTSRWVDIFQNVPNIAAISKMVQFSLAVPGSNAVCERLFSETNHYWSKSKSRLAINTVKKMSLRYHLAGSCEEMLTIFQADPQLREELRRGTKYSDPISSEQDELNKIFEQELESEID